MTIRRRIAAIAAATVAALTLAACSSGGSGGDEATADGLTKISFMYSPYADYAGFFVAQEKGYFEEAGLEVELIAKGGSSGETFQHVSTGNVTGGGASWGAGLFNATAAGASLNVLGGVSRIPESGPNPSPVMASNTSSIETLEDLKGAKIGVPGQTGFGLYSIYKALISGGLTLEDVELVNLGPGDIIPAMANGSIDASWTVEPISAALKQEDIAHEITDISYHAGTELGAVLFNAEFVEKNSDAVTAFMAAYLKAAHELADGGWDDPQTQEIIAEYTDLPASMLAEIALTEADPEAEINWDDVEKQEEFLRAQGVLEFEGESGVKEVFRDDIRQQAVEKLAELKAN